MSQRPGRRRLVSASAEDGVVGEELCSTGGKLSTLFSCGGIVFVATFLALLGLWVIHTATLWVSLDPTNAFHEAKRWVKIWSAIPTFSCGHCLPRCAPRWKELQA